MCFAFNKMGLNVWNWRWRETLAGGKEAAVGKQCIIVHVLLLNTFEVSEHRLTECQAFRSGDHSL